jgi:hypothetical protein
LIGIVVIIVVFYFCVSSFRSVNAKRGWWGWWASALISKELLQPVLGLALAFTGNTASSAPL